MVCTCGSGLVGIRDRKALKRKRKRQIYYVLHPVQFGVMLPIIWLVEAVDI